MPSRILQFSNTHEIIENKVAFNEMLGNMIQINSLNSKERKRHHGGLYEKSS